LRIKRENDVEKDNKPNEWKNKFYVVQNVLRHGR
jgi:hypothetical protein